MCQIETAPEKIALNLRYPKIILMLPTYKSIQIYLQVKPPHLQIHYYKNS